MVKKFKNIIDDYKNFVYNISDNTGELIACVLYMTFCAGMITVVLGIAESNYTILGSGLFAAGGVLALTHSV